MTVWKVLHKRLCFKPYKMWLVQALTPADKVKRRDFCEEMLLKMEENDFVERLICDETTLHISGKVNLHNVRIWGTEQPHAQIEHQRDSRSQRFLCGVPQESARPIFLQWSNCDWLLISRHVGKLVVTSTEHQLWRLRFTTGWCSPPHFHRNVWVLLNRVHQQRWIGRAAKGDNHLLLWPSRTQNLTPCNFFLWGFVKDSVYVPPLPMSLNELRDQITHALQTITADMLHRVWDEFDYRVHVCHVTQGAHIEGLWLTHEKLGQLPLLMVYVVPV